MSTRRFRTGHDPQPYLLPPAVTDWRPADHPAYARRALVDQLDLAPGYAAYGPKGQPPYDPRVMVRIWVYAYARGVRSSRQVERACGDDRGFRVVAGNQQPDFWTLAPFRRRHAAALGNLLQESVRLAAAVGVVRLRDVAGDGTKIKAAASKNTAMRYARLVERLPAVEREVAAFLADTAAADQAADAAAAAEPAARHAVKVQAAADAGRPASPAPATPAVPAPKAQTNFPDPDSRIMRNSEKAFIQGYNAQLAVAADHQRRGPAERGDSAAGAGHPHLPPRRLGPPAVGGRVAGDPRAMGDGAALPPPDELPRVVDGREP
jgi:transposase